MEFVKNFKRITCRKQDFGPVGTRPIFCSMFSGKSTQFPFLSSLFYSCFSFQLENVVVFIRNRNIQHELRFPIPKSLNILFLECCQNTQNFNLYSLLRYHILHIFTEPKKRIYICLSPKHKKS